MTRRWKKFTSTREHLEGARSYLQKKGWTKRWKQTDQSVCINGALVMAMLQDEFDQHDISEQEMETTAYQSENPKLRVAVKALFEQLPYSYLSNQFGSGWTETREQFLARLERTPHNMRVQTLIRWNDNIATSSATVDDLIVQAIKSEIQKEEIVD